MTKSYNRNLMKTLDSLMHPGILTAVRDAVGLLSTVLEAANAYRPWAVTTVLDCGCVQNEQSNLVAPACGI